MAETADVIIIGAGVHGTSLAFHLADAGASVIVLERAWIGAGATGRSSGLVRMHYDLLAETKLAVWASFPYFTDWARRVGGECGFTNTGFLWLEHGDGEARVRANVDSHRALGIDTTLVHADDIARLAPPRWPSTVTRSRPTGRPPATRTRRWRRPDSCGPPRPWAHGWSRVPR